jgi:membrane protein YdbS with pleckstrin-like domain
MNKLNQKIVFVFFFKNCVMAMFLLSFWFMSVSIYENNLPHTLNHVQQNALIVIFLDAIGLLLLTAGVLIGYFWAWLSYASYHYELRPDGLWIEHGVVLKSRTTIPYNHVQNAELYINPIITRLLGIYTINIQTRDIENTSEVLSKASNIHLPGLTAEMAAQLKGELINLSHVQIPQRKFFNATTGQYQ